MSVVQQGGRTPGCPVCRCPSTAIVEVPYPFIRWSDYRTVKRSACVGRCSRCHTIFHVLDPADVERIEEEWTDEAGPDYPMTGQTFSVQEFDRPMTRSFLQARLIAGLLVRKDPSVLDVGCFDGALLVELDLLLPGARLHGFDRYESSGRHFPSRPNFRFWSGDLADVRGDYDIVTISHTLMYERNTAKLIERVESLLKPGGVLFIQTPNIVANPAYLLMADQFYYYSPTVLGATLRHFGFSLELVPNEWFPREIVAIASKGGYQRSPDPKTDITLVACLAALDEKAARLGQLDRKTSIGVLGTTAAAAFVDGLLDNVAYFVDENPSSVGRRFRDKPVVHPESLKASDLVVLPFGTSGQGIMERLERSYSGDFIVV